MIEQEIDKKYPLYIEKLNNNSLFNEVLKSLGYERVGIQITKNKSIFLEYTSFNKGGKVIKIKKGLVDPSLIIGLEADILKKLISEEELEWIEKNPIEAAFKYEDKVKIPNSIKLKVGSYLLEKIM